MSGLEFTDDAAKQLEKLYLTMDVAAQRLETIRHLNLSTPPFSPRMVPN